VLALGRSAGPVWSDYVHETDELVMVEGDRELENGSVRSIRAAIAMAIPAGWRSPCSSTSSASPYTMCTGELK
jgi:hypothetical protein